MNIVVCKLASNFNLQNPVDMDLFHWKTDDTENA